MIEGFLTNVGGLLTLISSVPNIIVGTAAGISFVTFFLKASPFVAVATIVSLVIGAKVFGIRSLVTREERAEAARLVAVTIIHKQKIPLSFASFVKKAAPFALAQIVLALIYVLFVM